MTAICFVPLVACLMDDIEENFDERIKQDLGMLGEISAAGLF